MSLSNEPSTFDFKATISDNRLIGLWRMLLGFRWPYLGAVISVGLAALLRTGNSLLLRYFVDDVLVQESFSAALPWIGLSFVFLALGQGAFSFLSGRWAAYTAEGVSRRVRDYLYDHIQRLPFAYHDQTQTGELIQRATSDVEAIRQFFADQAIGAGRIVLIFSVNFVALAALNVRLALLSVLVIPFILVMSLFFFRKISKAYEALQDQEARLSTTLQENLTGMRVVKAFARQAYESEKFDQDNWERYERGRRLLTLHSLFWPTSDVLCGAQMLFGFFVGAVMALEGAISVGDYVAAASLIIWLIWPMRNLGRLIVQMSTGMVSYKRVIDLVAEEREPLDDGIYAPEVVRGEVAFRAVSFGYEDGDGVVLRDISFHCRPGQSVALLGSTGSGKTSLVNLLPRFYAYTGGDVTLDDRPLTVYSRRYLRRQIGIVEQEPFLFSRTIRENITYGVGREVSEEDVVEAARAAAIHDVIESFPGGYDTLVGEKGVTLSGGQKQRVAIARTLLKDPRILILDDATSSVDTETEGEIRQALERLMDGRTTFIIAHRIQSVMDADLILVLDQGQVVQRGTHEELMAENGIYRQIYDVQARVEDELQRELDDQDSSFPQPPEVWEDVWEKELSHVAV
jgi:ATP-binding cassette, subfamily B, bacterial